MNRYEIAKIIAPVKETIEADSYKFDNQGVVSFMIMDNMGVAKKVATFFGVTSVRKIS
jgi:hypothetical protein